MAVPSSSSRTTAAAADDLTMACLESTSIRELRSILRRSLQIDPGVCGRADSLEGKLPLHFLALNRPLILQSNASAGFGSSGGSSTTTTRTVEQFILDEVIPAHLEAIVTLDDNGRIPFTESITTWIRNRRTLRGWKVAESLTSTPADKLRMLAEQTKKRLCDKQKRERELRQARGVYENISSRILGEYGLGVNIDDDADSDVLSDEEDDDDDDSEQDLPAMVEWSLQMLSTILDEVLSVSQLGSASSTSAFHNRTRTTRNGASSSPSSILDWETTSVQSDGGGSSTFSSSSSTRARRRGSCSSAMLLRSRLVDIASSVVQQVAAIPHLMQELLLIQDREARGRVFDLSLVHKVLFCETSLGDGKWIIDMLKRGLKAPGYSNVDKSANEKRNSNTSLQSTNHGQRLDHEGYWYAEGAVFYLEAISNLDIRDDLEVQIAHGGNGGGARAAVSLVGDVRQFRKHQGHLLRAVGRLEGLVRLIVVQHEALVNRAAVTPVVQRFLDQQIFSPLALTSTVFEFVEHILMIACFRLGPAAAMFHLSQLDTGFQSQRYLVSNMVLISCVAFFFLKETHRAIAKYALSIELFWNDLGSFWNILDLLPIVLVPVCILVVDSALRRGGALLQSEQQSAVEVDNGAIPFYLRLLIALTTPLLWLRVLSHIKMQNRQLATFILCSVEIMKDIKWFMLVLFVAMSAFAQMMVSLTNEPRVVGGEVESSFEGYLKAYTLMLGDFDSFSFRKHPTITVLFIFYTFGVTIVLLNILIAIVSESYTKSMVSAKIMLSKARLMFVARLMSVNYFHRLWRRGEMGSTRRNLNIFALAFGICMSMRIVHTVKAKLVRLGQLSIYDEDSPSYTGGTSSPSLLNSPTVSWGCSMMTQIDIEAMFLFIIVSGLVFIMRMTMVLLQNATDDKGMAVGNTAQQESTARTTARSSWLDTILSYYVKELYAFIGSQIDRLGGEQFGTNNDGITRASESASLMSVISSANESTGGRAVAGNQSEVEQHRDHQLFAKVSRSVAASSRADIKTEMKRTTDQILDALSEQSERTLQAQNEQLEAKLKNLKLEMVAIQQEMMRSLLKTSEERIARSVVQGRGEQAGVDLDDYE